MGDRAAPPSVLVAQISDTHVVASGSPVSLVDNNSRLADVVAAIGRESPSPAAVMATGDLTETGSVEEFEALFDLLAPLPCPVLPIPGNHDRADVLRRFAPSMDWSATGHASWVEHLGHLRVIGLDSTDGRSSAGIIDDLREGWLRHVLADPHQGPTILALHHPPFESGIVSMDDSRLKASERLTAVLFELGGVDRVVCGHLHRPMSSTIAGIPVEVGLSTTLHVDLDLRPEGGLRVVDDPIGYRLWHVVGDTLVGHTRYVTPTGSAPPS